MSKPNRPLVKPNAAFVLMMETAGGANPMINWKTVPPEIKPLELVVPNMPPWEVVP